MRWIYRVFRASATRAERSELGLPEESRGGIVPVGKISEQRRALEEERWHEWPWLQAVIEALDSRW
jgi:hypothetical protein